MPKHDDDGRVIFYCGRVYRLFDRLERGEIGRGACVRLGKPEDGMKAVLLGINSGLDLALTCLRSALLGSAWGMDIGSGSRISLTATLDKANPRGVHIGPDTYVSSRAGIMAHDSAQL